MTLDLDTPKKVLEAALQLAHEAHQTRNQPLSAVRTAVLELEGTIRTIAARIPPAQSHAELTAEINSLIATDDQLGPQIPLLVRSILNRCLAALASPASAVGLPAAVCSCGDHCNAEGSRCPVCVAELAARAVDVEALRSAVAALCEVYGNTLTKDPSAFWRAFDALRDAAKITSVDIERARRARLAASAGKKS